MIKANKTSKKVKTIRKCFRKLLPANEILRHLKTIKFKNLKILKPTSFSDFVAIFRFVLSSVEKLKIFKDFNSFK